MRTILVHDHAGLREPELMAVARAVGAHRTLADVVAWGGAQQPPLVVVDVVTQDEYTHDVIVPLARDRYLAYDAT